MTHLLLIASTTAMLASARTFAAPAPNYTLTGKIEGLATGWVYLLHEEREKNEVDSVQAKDGAFTFQGTSETPEYCLLGIVGKTGRKEYRLGFFLDKGEVSIAGKSDHLADAVITGGPTQQEYIQYKESQKELEDLSSKLDKIYNDARMKKDQPRIDSAEKAYAELDIKQRQAVKDYVSMHPASYVSAYEVYTNFSYNPDVAVLHDIYGMIDASMKTTFFGKRIKETLDAAEMTDIGKPAPDFTQNDVAGKPLTLSSLKGKYVLVDFWASWCGPCRAENPSVVKAYNTYKAKGFTVLGVSLDDKKDKWIEAIKKDQLAWAQVSDLKGWQNSAASLYGVKGIPMNYLLDKDGKIVAKGLRGEDLDKKLAELLH